MPQKKSKRKAQHAMAINGYKKWLENHPKATHKEKFEQFDMFVDTSQLVEDHRALQATST
jgi:hypothetical protein